MSIDPKVRQDGSAADPVTAEPEYEIRNGAPFDRGGADAYYKRPYAPHYFRGKTYLSPKVTQLTKKEIAAYAAGYHGQTEQKD